MILSAIYIEEHFLFDKPQIVNLGANYIFEFELNKDGLKIFAKKNEEKLEGYFGDISLMTAVVGANGAGKTSFLRVLNQGLDKTNTIFFYEKGDQILILNLNEVELSEVNFDYILLKNNEELYPLYYSPNLDFDIQDIFSPISPSRKFKETLSEYFFDNLERQLIFLNDPKIDYLKSIYPDLPTFERLDVKVNNLNKNSFLNIYKEANLGKSLNAELEMLWKNYRSNSDLIHNDDDFLKNLKIMLLSLLVLNDIFTQTNNNGFDISFDEVLKQRTFIGKLDKFLEKRISNIDGPSYNILNARIGIKVSKADELIKEIDEFQLTQISGGFDFNMIKRSMIACISSFKAVYDFYNFIRSFNIRGRVKKQNQKVFAEFKINELNDISKLISEYKKLISNFKSQSSNFRILNFYPDKKFSTGEKSLIDFFSSLSYFSIDKTDHQRHKDNYLLLLDEPEQGYHALWKKKFVEAIIKVVPKIFEDLDKKPKIQIVFTTHDALTLSDIPNNNLILLDKENNRIISRSEVFEKSSFGANISDILSDSFFIGDGLIGEYIKKKIQDIIDYLRKKKDVKIDWIKEPKDAKKLIDLIGEPFLRDKLNDMFLEVFPELKKSEIEKLKQKIKYLENGSNNI